MTAVTSIVMMIAHSIVMFAMFTKLSKMFNPNQVTALLRSQRRLRKPWPSGTHFHLHRYIIQEQSFTTNFRTNALCLSSSTILWIPIKQLISYGYFGTDAFIPFSSVVHTWKAILLSERKRSGMTFIRMGLSHTFVKCKAVSWDVEVEHVQVSETVRDNRCQYSRGDCSMRSARVVL